MIAAVVLAFVVAVAVVQWTVLEVGGDRQFAVYLVSEVDCPTLLRHQEAGRQSIL